MGGLEQTVRTTGIINTVYDLRALPISLPDGRSVRLWAQDADGWLTMSAVVELT